MPFRITWYASLLDMYSLRSRVVERVEVHVPACWRDEEDQEERGKRRARGSKRRHLPLSYEEEGKSRRVQEEEEEDEEEVIKISNKSNRKGKDGALESERRHLQPSYERENKRSVQEKEEEVVLMKPSSRKGTKGSGGRAVWEPPHWREQLANIREMRKKRDAPVDTEGAAALADKDCPPKVSGGVESGRKGRSDRVPDRQTDIVHPLIGPSLPGACGSDALQSNQGPGDSRGHGETEEGRAKSEMGAGHFSGEDSRADKTCWILEGEGRLLPNKVSGEALR